MLSRRYRPSGSSNSVVESTVATALPLPSSLTYQEMRSNTDSTHGSSWYTYPSSSYQDVGATPTVWYTHFVLVLEL